MTARLVLPPGAPEEEWLAARRRGVTASEIATVLGISPFDSAFNLYWKKRGDIGEDYDDDRLALGRALEPYTASRFQKANPDLYLTAPAGLWASMERPWQLATPDGLITENCGPGCFLEDHEHLPVAVWEGKSSGTYEEWGEDGTGEIPAYIRAQVLWQMDVIGVGTAYVSCLFLSTQQIRTYEVEYDVVDVDLMRKHGFAFWERVQAGDVPELDAHAATAAALKALHPDVDPAETVTIPAGVADYYRSAKAMAKAAENDVTLAENRLRAAMGDAKYAIGPDGQKVATRSVYDRRGYTVAPARIDRLNPAPIKKETPA